MYLVSAFNAVGVRQLSAGFPTEQAATDFIKLEVERLLDSGARYLVLIDETTRIRQMYRAQALADCIFVAVDWARALIDEAGSPSVDGWMGEPEESSRKNKRQGKTPSHLF